MYAKHRIQTSNEDESRESICRSCIKKSLVVSLSFWEGGVRLDVLSTLGPDRFHFEYSICHIYTHEIEGKIVSELVLKARVDWMSISSHS
jgi:hypothetical protein